MNNFHQQTTIDLLKDKRAEIINIAARHGAFNVRIFGSVARSQAHKDSDIDFLVDYSLDDISPWFRCWFETRFRKIARSQRRCSYGEKFKRTN